MALCEKNYYLMAQSGQVTACRCLLLPLWKFPNNVIIFNWPCWAPAPFYRILNPKPFFGLLFSLSTPWHASSFSLVASKYSSPNLLDVTIFWPGLILNLPSKMRELCPAGALVSGLTQCSLAENSALRCSFCPEDLTFSHCRSVIKIEKKSFIHSSAPESMPVF
jgi:hypothetical protein